MMLSFKEMVVTCYATDIIQRVLIALRAFRRVDKK